LLDAAEELFADRGFDRTTVRDIAGRAGVNQSLLFRYFGSKDALFAAVLARTGRHQLAESPPDELFARMLRGILDNDRPQARDHAMQMLLRSSGHDAAADEIRQELGQDYVRALTASTDAPDADLRAHLAVAWVVGIDLLRTMTPSVPLADADDEQIVQLVMHAVGTLLERVKDVSPAHEQ
jgi:AcrR family transcriptional regulator